MASAGGTPGGVVEFHDGNVTLGTAALTGGSAVYHATGLSAGRHNIFAVYYPQVTANVYYLRSSTSTMVSVNPITTSLALVSSLTPITPGVAFDLTATITGGSPSGSVVFVDGSTILGTATLVGGVAVFHDLGLAAGKHKLQAVYNSQVIGDNYYLSSQSPILAVTV